MYTVAPTLTDALHARGMRVTPQRLAVREALDALGRHATAEQVHAEVASRVPGVSLPTVYATLELLEELGTVRRVPGASGAALYDPRTEPHQHAVCRACGGGDDLDRPGQADAAPRPPPPARLPPPRARTVLPRPLPA